ncbi:putative alpha-(1-3)-fucosyltransferase 4-like [Scophthalmus maximus]|uniref:Fucosyltransferase n=1 Tax=Scophthalmus maximus TaxID=52904 RepID=A0A2U9B541_SCOMX|nr:alpha-(1,3)-fucosyltransferase 4-like [Scophthalmus maximus]AWO98935.1 putative alpha-(1-3)-fucosyltransferase 4-like [Scophthalmus maximus]
MLCSIHKGTCSACVAAAGFLSLVGVCLLYLPDPFALEPRVSVSAQERPVTLLIWTHPFGRHQTLPDCSALRQVGGCTLTADRSAYPRADAVVVHHREVATGAAELPPEPRPCAQKWIWLNYESPAHTPGLWRFEGVFNLTMSYRTDSDIFLPYGYLIPRVRGAKHVPNRSTHPLHSPPRSHLLRPRLLAWVISNWSESHARVALYRQLRRYIQVDVYGSAGRPVPEDRGGGGGSGSVVRLLGRYQFYLALENSQHTDYITEKLWNAVLAGAVPVVLGPSRENYERFLPPEAFIHVDDFPTVRGLALYLLMLRRNPSRLRRHLDWRGGYSLHRPALWAEHYCAACRATRRTRGRTDVVKDLTTWFRS